MNKFAFLWLSLAFTVSSLPIKKLQNAVVNSNISKPMKTSAKNLDSGDGEIQEVSLPHPDYGSPINEKVIMQYNFGNTWGFVNNVDYAPPTKKFNRVVVSLSAQSSKIQFDRLAHMFIGDVEVWRTSTAEPNGNDITFGFTKDLSDYVSLFSKDGTLKFELDNVIDNTYTGSFNITLTAHYYNYEGDSNILRDQVTADVYNFTGESALEFDTVKYHPSSVIPVIKPSTSSGAPMISLPNDKFSYSMPKVAANTTRAILRLYITGNGDEEFWYSNTVDPYADHFKDHGNDYAGKGPIRVIKTYINGELVSVDAPPPVIYTGGISPTFWSPVVGLKAYDIDSIDVDLTALLPNLQDDFSIKVEVETGTQGSGNTDITPDQNWITTGSLLLWQNKDVVSLKGSASVKQLNSVNTVDVTTPSDTNMTQLAQYVSVMSHTSNFSICFTNNTCEDHSILYDIATVFVNNQTYTAYGSNTTTDSEIYSTKVLSHNGNIATFHHVYTTIADLDYRYVSNGVTGLSGQIVQQNEQSISKGDNKLTYLWTEDQRGTTDFYFDSNSGNHGTGNVKTTVTLDDYVVDKHYSKEV